MKASFPVFYMIWADLQGWEVPEFHLRVCAFLESYTRTGLLMMPRGHGKSTILGVYNAWRYYCNQKYRILHQGDQDKTAYKTSRDSRAILQRHPLVQGMEALRGEVAFWWCPESDDERNPSMQASGILSNITSSRADEIQNDDVEVPRNIGSAELREKLRDRLTEQVHILVPGGKKLFVGTPHTHQSLYEDVKAGGADCLILRMFERESRTENAEHALLDFRPEYVFTGIGKHARLLEEGRDYQIKKQKGGAWSVLLLEKAALLDCYGPALWPERFTREEMASRRQECRTVNMWDSQYQLHAKPINNVRLDPDRMIAYDCEPEIRMANGTAGMWLGGVQIVGLACHWDPSSGKKDSDVSALAIVLQDGHGRRYWHRSIQLQGDVAEFGGDGKTITGGQVWQICDAVERFGVSRVSIETNGAGAFAPAVLKAALRQRKLVCGVGGEHERTEKNLRIMQAFEPLLLSSGMLWAHMSVLESDVPEKMQQFNPATKSNEDDELDAASKAITAQPERIQSHRHHKVGKPTQEMREDWRTSGGVYDVAVEF